MLFHSMHTRFWCIGALDTVGDGCNCSTGARSWLVEGWVRLKQCLQHMSLLLYWRRPSSRECHDSGPSNGCFSGCILPEAFVVSHPGVTLKLRVSLDYQVLVTEQIWDTFWLFPGDHSHVYTKTPQPFHHVSNGAAFVLACLLAFVHCCSLSGRSPLISVYFPTSVFDSFSGTDPNADFSLPFLCRGHCWQDCPTLWGLGGPNSWICASPRCHTRSCVGNM